VIDMLNRLLSGDLPRSRVLAVLLLLIFLGLAAAPFVFPGVKALNVAAKVLIFVVLVASFDLLLGYTGIVSFAHTMFFGIGAYGVAIASSRMGAGWGALALGLGAALLVSLLLSLAIGLFSLRVRAIFFAMITLAVAAAFQTLASQLSDWTGGEDGLSFKLPEWLSPSFEPFDNEVLGVLIDGRIITYYLLFVLAVGLVLALWLRYNGPDTSLSFEIMMDCLLIVVIGGMGTIYGAAIGSVLFLIAQSYLQDLLRVASEAAHGLPWLAALLSPDRWLLWLGLLFVLSVYYFPTGVVGRLRFPRAKA
jgi:branched-chain amino acid transport system permease protein